jgi:hypothetical protein
MHDEPGSNDGCRSTRHVARLIRGVAGTLCLLVHGCDTVHGGAVELSWKLRPASSSLSDKFVDCDSGQPGTNPVTAIRLHWQVDEPGGGASGSSQEWPCELNHGVTRFDLAEGTADLWVTPQCAFGDAAPDTYIAPAIVRREVAKGDTVSLGAVELVVSVSYCQDAHLDAGVPSDAAAPGDAGVPTDSDVPTQRCICDHR